MCRSWFDFSHESKQGNNRYRHRDTGSIYKLGSGDHVHVLLWEWEYGLVFCRDSHLQYGTVCSMDAWWTGDISFFQISGDSTKLAVTPIRRVIHLNGSELYSMWLITMLPSFQWLVIPQYITGPHCWYLWHWVKLCVAPCMAYLRSGAIFVSRRWHLHGLYRFLGRSLAIFIRYPSMLLVSSSYRYFDAALSHRSTHHDTYSTVVTNLLLLPTQAYTIMEHSMLL